MKGFFTNDRSSGRAYVMKEFALFYVFVLVFSHPGVLSVPCGSENICSCYFNEANLYIVNCSNSGLTSLPDIYDIHDPIDSLILSHNMIKVIEKGNLRGKQIRLIDLSVNEIDSFSDSAFKDVAGLEELYVRNNKLTTAPLALRGLNALRKLDFHRNSIASISTDSFDGLENLIYLDLGDNKIEYSLAREALARLTKLETLVLCGTGALNFPQNLLKGKRKLRHLMLSHNHIKRLPVPTFWNDFPNLEVLKLHHNPIVFDDTPSPLLHLHKLQTLTLSECHLEHMRTMFFRHFRNLKQLVVRNCNVTDIEPKLFDKWSSLEELDISSNPIEEPIEPEVFEGLQNHLTHLNLESMGITVFPVKIIAFLRKLIRFHLEGNQIHTIPERAIADLKTKELHLYLERNRIISVSKYVMENAPEKVGWHLDGNEIKSLAWIEHDPCIYRNTHIHVDKNPLHCSCKTMRMVQMKVVEISGVCRSPNDFASLVLEPDDLHGHHKGHTDHATGSGVSLESTRATYCSNLTNLSEDRYECSCQSFVPRHSQKTCRASFLQTGHLAILLVLCLCFVNNDCE